MENYYQAKKDFSPKFCPEAEKSIRKNGY